jgi:hypothetical protein
MGIHPNPTDQPYGISLPPGTVLGYRADGRPIHLIAGGAEDDEPDIEVEVDEEPEPEPEADPEPDDKPKPKPPVKKDDPKPGDDDYTPPSKSEWARAQAALKKANDEAKTQRLRNKELEEKARGDETEHEKALREAREEGEKKYRTPLVRTALRGALVEAGALAFLEEEKDPKSDEALKKAESRMGRMLKLIDTDGLDLDEAGSVSGVDAAVAELTRDYPEWFSAPSRKPKARPTGAPRPAAAEKPKTTAEIHAARILGRA